MATDTVDMQKTAGDLLYTQVYVPAFFSKLAEFGFEPQTEEQAASLLRQANMLLQARAADMFQGADLALGQKLIDEHKCVACHTSKVGGDGSAIYKPQGKINTAGLLRGMVEMCNTNMNLGMFPEEVDAVAAVLNRDHYKFTK